MNKTAVFLGIVCLVIVGIAGATLLIAIGRDATPIISFIGTVLAVVIGAALQLNSNAKIAERQEHIAKVVNGNTSALIGMVDETALTPGKRAELASIKDNNERLATGVTPVIENGGGRHVAS